MEGDANAAAGSCSLFADLPASLQEKVLADPHMDARGRMALFQGSQLLADSVVAHARQRALKVTHGAKWPASLARLFNRWGTQPLGATRSLWHLHVSQGSGTPAGATLPAPPPAAISRHVSHLHLRGLALGPAPLAAWRLHDEALWPELRDLTLADCVPDTADGDAQPQPQLLQPVTALRSLSLFFASDVTLDRWAGPAWQPLAALAARARQLHMEGEARGWRPLRAVADVVRSLPRLTRARLPGRLEGWVEGALMEHPCLEHVELGFWHDLGTDRSQQPCRFKTLTLLQEVGVAELALRPLGGLERLAVHGGLHVAGAMCTSGLGGGGVSGRVMAERGLELLQRLHAARRLALLPARGGGSWRLPGGAAGLFGVHAGRERQLLVPLLRLAVEAGQGVTALRVDWSRPVTPLCTLRDEVVPLLRRGGGGVRALCLDVCASTPPEWCAALLGVLSGCVARVHVQPEGCGTDDQVRAMVEGGARALRHPLTLTLVHHGSIGEQQEAELRALLTAGLGAGGEGAKEPSLLTLNVVYVQGHGQRD